LDYITKSKAINDFVRAEKILITCTAYVFLQAVIHQIEKRRAIVSQQNRSWNSAEAKLTYIVGKMSRQIDKEFIRHTVTVNLKIAKQYFLKRSSDKQSSEKQSSDEAAAELKALRIQLLKPIFCRRETDNLTRKFFEKTEWIMEFDSGVYGIVEEIIAAAANMVLLDQR
jgi:hypothetical protein